ncbi:LysR family transcriptional regulator [Hydrogenophaga sp. RWCD_12]|uniref:LysR family transcriptional regulator n=1 Tax=Hydrogenophaga sp. RWCD_12 TaxID=3391190 RepID=UPI003984CB8A
MDIYQLRTFVAVAREGSITRASERVFLSQPAVSAHIKAIEDTLGITLFERTVRGMSLTSHGQLILVKAEQALGMHREVIDEATRIRGRLAGRLRLGASSSATTELTSRLLKEFSERHPEVNVSLQHCTSLDPVSSICNGDLDAGFYDEASEPNAELSTIETSRFEISLVASTGLVSAGEIPKPHCFGDVPWIYPTSNPCYAQAAESLFRQYNFRPKQVISVDHENVTRVLLAHGVGVGLLQEAAAREAQMCGDVTVVCSARKAVRVLYAQLASRAQDPLLYAVRAILSDLIGCSGTKQWLAEDALEHFQLGSRDPRTHQTSQSVSTVTC